MNIALDSPFYSLRSYRMSDTLPDWFGKRKQSAYLSSRCGLSYLRFRVDLRNIESDSRAHELNICRHGGSMSIVGHIERFLRVPGYIGRPSLFNAFKK